MAQLVLWSPLSGDVNFPVAIGGPGSSLTQTRDPTTADSGFNVGTVWFNATAGQLRWWECRKTGAAGAGAGWVFGGADYANGGTNPASEVTAFGSGSGLMAEEGNINRQIASAGVSPGGLTADNVLAFYSLPAGSFDVSGRGISITAQGSIVSSANAKRVKIIFNPSTAVVGSTVGSGGTIIADSGAIPTSQAGGWILQANVFKYGAAGSNTQIGLHQLAQVPGAAQVPPVAPSLIAATESGAILIAVTGNVAVTATDIVFNFLEINAMN